MGVIVLLCPGARKNPELTDLQTEIKKQLFTSQEVATIAYR